MTSSIKIAIIEDHQLLRNGLAIVLKRSGFELILEADNGKDFISKFDNNNTPDVVLTDINMPEMDGFEVTLWLKKNFPLISVLALSMYDEECAVIRMLRNGAKGYILKDSEPQELTNAINSIISQGYYYSEVLTGTVQDYFTMEFGSNRNVKLNEKEMQFLNLACTELTYKEIGDRMFLSPRTIDAYRELLFEKFNVRNRIGLVLKAIKKGLVTFG